MTDTEVKGIDPEERARWEREMAQREREWTDFKHRLDRSYWVRLILGLPATMTFLVLMLASIYERPEVNQFWGTAGALAALLFLVAVQSWPVPRYKKLDLPRDGQDEERSSGYDVAARAIENMEEARNY